VRVLKLFRRLRNNQAFNQDLIDGIFGEKTESAVIRFQEKHTLYADDKVGATTWQILHGALEIHIEEKLHPVRWF